MKGKTSLQNGQQMVLTLSIVLTLLVPAHGSNLPGEAIFSLSGITMQSMYTPCKKRAIRTLVTYYPSVCKLKERGGVRSLLTAYFIYVIPSLSYPVKERLKKKDRIS